MKRKWFFMILSGILSAFLLVLVLPPTPAAAWFSFPTGASQHSGMARDSLVGLGWTNTQIGQVPFYADQLDLYSPDHVGSGHRITKYEDIFESYGGAVCSFDGAETWAADYLTQARESYLNNDKANGDKFLGYTIHYIQDSVCPAHVFPFNDGLFAAHFNFEFDSNSNYLSNAYQMQNAVQDAAVTEISSPEDLTLKMESAADTVYTFPCKYVREDGVRIGNPPLRGYAISIDYVIDSIEMASGLAKGAALYATGVSTDTAPVVTLDTTDQAVNAGSTATFTAAATGSPVPTVQWQLSTTGGESWTDITGATSYSYTTPSTTSDMNGYRYRAVFTNTAGTDTSSTATLTVNSVDYRPIVSGVEPDAGYAGKSYTVTITGSNFSGATAVSFGAKITVKRFTVNSDSQITAQISINKKAATGPRDINVTTSEGTGTGSGLFTVN